MADPEQVSSANLLDQLAMLDPRERREVATIVRRLSENLAEVRWAGLSPACRTVVAFGALVRMRSMSGESQEITAQRERVENFVNCKGNILRLMLAQTVLFAAVAAFAISVVVGGQWWTTPPPSVDVKAVGQQVVDLLRDQVTTSGEFKDYGITVTDNMTLINTSLNKYDGLATMYTRKGTQKFLEVTVWADPTGAMFYKIDPASAASLVEAASKEENPSP